MCVDPKVGDPWRPVLLEKFRWTGPENLIIRRTNPFPPQPMTMPKAYFLKSQKKILYFCSNT